MKITLNSVLVQDQDEALTIYTERLGFVKKADIAIGHYRWLTVAAPEGIAGVELALEPMAFEPARVYQRALFEAGIPATAFVSRDIAAEAARLRARGVVVRGEPAVMGPITAVMFEDGCGNLIHLVQPLEESAEEPVLATSRVIDFGAERVFQALADPRELALWWGPKGFSNRFEVFEFRPGGSWRFTMHGPDGTLYPNESRFTEIVADELVALRHVNWPNFDLRISLQTLGPGRCRIGWHMRFDSAEMCAKVRQVVVPANEENLDRLEAALGRPAP
ncbi:hypothetical protein RA210_U120083 [Rubrivivax sp. A210]|uniref:SRPBCC domain-containing protein n=1 Tax=Rubrivivax sp. A210 TaxID=2772301 RepID=UPI0019192258|nr:SRPBCC domain-containing protein [Rubrivivax sp. A210]CAD5370255.1 hypothetical protein RA210_U120083 [Rubrivivax sp. A210]